MATVLNFKEIIDKPEWRPISNALNAHAAGISVCNDLRTSDDRHPYMYQLVSNTIFNTYGFKADEWLNLVSPALAGTFGAGAGCIFVPSAGPNGTIAAGATTTTFTLTTALPAAVGTNQLANRGAGGKGFKIRIIGNSAAASGKTEERFIVANTSGTTPLITVDSAFSFTPALGDRYEFVSGRVFLLGSGALAAGIWKFYDIATNSYSGNLTTTNLPGTITTDFSAVVLDESYCPVAQGPSKGFFGNLVATGSAATTLTGQAAAGDAGVATNEYRNFQIRIVQDTAIPTAAGQRRKITSHTAGASPVYTVPAWSVTPSTTATYVIEGNNDILLWTTVSTSTFAYAAGYGADAAWSTALYAVRPGAMGAGCTSAWSFGITLDAGKNARYSNIFSFRGGNVATLDVFDIAAAATGVWAASTYGNSGPLFTTGTAGEYDPWANSGRYLYINQNGGQRMLRFDVLDRVLEPFATIRFGQGAALVGGRIATTAFFDGATIVSFIYAQRSSNIEFFECLVST